MNRFTFAVVAIVIGMIGTGCVDQKKKSGTAIEEKFTVKRMDLRDVITQTGEVAPLVKVELKSEASGKIDKIYVKDGQKVSKRDTILVIDPSRLKTQKEKLELQLQRSKLDMQTADRDYANNMELLKTGAISDKKMQDVQVAKEMSEISYKQQMLELKDVNDQLGKTVITSPMSGVITSLLVSEGEIAVSATSGFQSGTSIGTIADISKLEVISSIGEVDYVHLSKGQKVVIRPEAIENAQTYGTISFISLNAKKRNNDELATFEVRVSIDSLIPGVAPGINVNVDFVILEKKSVLCVPFHYVRKERGKSFVDIVKKGDDGQRTVKPVEVTTGSTDFRFIEIVSGLKEGDRVNYRMDTPEDEKNMKKPGQRTPNVLMGGGSGGGARRR